MGEQEALADGGKIFGAAAVCDALDDTVMVLEHLLRRLQVGARVTPVVV